MTEICIDREYVVMCSEPAQNLTIEDAYCFYAKVKTEKDLADLFAVVDNKSTWIFDEVYDFEDGSKEQQEAIVWSDQWYELVTKIKEDIFDILRSEGVGIPEKGYIVVLKPFMKRNGYRNGDGWWIKE